MTSARILLLACLVGILPGCSLLPGYSSSGSAALLDTAAAAFSAPKDVTLSAQQVAELPYASAYLRYGENPRAQVVLAFAHAGRHLYATSEGRLLTLQQGRLTALEGFPVDFSQRADRLPAPAQAVSAVAPVCWHGQRSVSGDVVAESEPVSACMTRVGMEAVALAFGARQLLRVDEDMLWLKSGQHHVSHFWLDPGSFEVLRSEQPIAPGQAVIRWESLKQPHAALSVAVEDAMPPPASDAFARLEVSSPPDDMPTDSVWLSVRAPAGQPEWAEKGRAVPANLRGLLLPYQWAEVYWPDCKLFSIDHDPVLAAQRAQVLAQLDELLTLRRRHERHDLIGSTLRLRDQVANWRLGHRVPLAGTPSWVSLKSERNLRLRDRHYVLLLNAKPEPRNPLNLQALTVDLPAVLAGKPTAHLTHQLQQLYQNQY